MLAMAASQTGRLEKSQRCRGGFASFRTIAGKNGSNQTRNVLRVTAERGIVKNTSPYFNEGSIIPAPFEEFAKKLLEKFAFHDSIGATMFP